MSYSSMTLIFDRADSSLKSVTNPGFLSHTNEEFEHVHSLIVYGPLGKRHYTTTQGNPQTTSIPGELCRVSSLDAGEDMKYAQAFSDIENEWTRKGRGFTQILHGNSEIVRLSLCS